jgi:hypothetical protein
MRGAQAMRRRADGLIPRAKNARGKVRGALPRTPAPFPFTAIFRNGPRPPGSAPQNLFKNRKDFSPPRTHRAPLTAPGRSEDFANEKGKGANENVKPSSFPGSARLPVVGPESVKKLQALIKSKEVRRAGRFAPSRLILQ